MGHVVGVHTVHVAAVAHVLTALVALACSVCNALYAQSVQVHLALTVIGTVVSPSPLRGTRGCNPGLLTGSAAFSH